VKLLAPVQQSDVQGADKKFQSATELEALRLPKEDHYGADHHEIASGLRTREDDSAATH
jgi:hypothetical protein